MLSWVNGVLTATATGRPLAELAAEQHYSRATAVQPPPASDAPLSEEALRRKEICLTCPTYDARGEGSGGPGCRRLRTCERGALTAAYCWRRGFCPERRFGK